MSKKIINTPNAPQAIGAYSQATIHGDLLFVSGQIPLKPQTAIMVDGPIEEQIEQVIVNLKAVCEAGGASLDTILKLNVYLRNLDDFDAVNHVMGQYFAKPFPARAAVEVSALPKGASIEMDAIAVIEE